MVRARALLGGLIVLAVATPSLPAFQIFDPEFRVTVIGDDQPLGAPLEARVVLDNPSHAQCGGGVASWSFGVCHDSTHVTLLDVQAGAATLTMNSGGPPDFLVINLQPNGFTVLTVASFLGLHGLPAGSHQELYRATYEAMSPGVSWLCMCGTLGSPPVEIGFAAANCTDYSFVPASIPGQLRIAAENCSVGETSTAMAY